MQPDPALLRMIPKVDDILSSPLLAPVLEQTAYVLVADAVRAELGSLRASILTGQCEHIPPHAELARAAALRAQKSGRMSLRPVLNATGVVLHTNLGRARLADCAARAAMEAASSYSTLEYNLDTGARGSRHDHVEALLAKLTGAPAAIAVNNNAAAVMLALSALARGREVVISRGELVEIGGSFRVPEIMEESGCILREVGSTNKTHLRDYEGAVDSDRTAALLKVHTSNFRMIGFTEGVGAKELAELAHKNGIPLLYDLGSGALLDPAGLGIPDEPWVGSAVADGADLICFSGDKLLGGPQAGILLGGRGLIERLRRHPLARAFRLDKMTLAALEATLRLYLEPARAREEIPTLRMLTQSQEELLDRARQLQAQLAAFAPGCSAAILETSGEVGGGSAPGKELASYAVAVSFEGVSASALEKKMREQDPPMVCRIAQDTCLLDVRCLAQDELEAAAECVRRCQPQGAL